VECAGWIPGIGSYGNGRGFRQNLRVLGEISILSDVFKEQDNISTGSDLFGIPLDLPVIPAPISNLKRNLHSIISEQEYNRIVLEGAKKSGSIGSVAQKEYALEEENLDYLFGPLSDLYGHGIPFFNPYAGLAAVRRHIEQAFTHGAKMAALSVDVKDKPIGDRWFPELVKNSPVPLMVKGVLSLDNARRAMDAGVKGLVLSNRGGRVLENLPPGYHMLEEVRKEAGDSVILVADGGIRNGEDVFKVLALGAHLVLIGRPIFISAAGAGMEGVAFYLNRIREELRNTMLLAGAKTVSEIKPHMIGRE
jgi:isopentenyl diphosphate isomerase/L-lactate dehydrogenase-like FMN-dependent dehydrogenase